MTTTSYCVKCKRKTESVGEQKIKTKNGRNAIKGKCAKCGTVKFKFVA
jgi:hypothetical protein